MQSLMRYLGPIGHKQTLIGPTVENIHVEMVENYTLKGKMTNFGHF